MMKRIVFLLFAVVLPFLYCHSETAPPEFLNYPGLIDVHAHIGEFRGYDLSLQNLLLNMEENHVQYALISNIDGAALKGFTADKDEITINRETARVASEHPQLIPLAWARPGTNGSSARNLEPFLRDNHFAGIKFHPDFNHFDPESPQVVPYLQLCEKYHVPALFHCGEHSAESLYRVARRFPHVPFVLYHMGFGTDHREAIEVARLAKKNNDALIYLETSQVKAPDLVRAVQQAGADQVVFGTDATYYGRYHYSRYSEALQTLQQAVSPQDFQKIIHENAVGLFHLQTRNRIE